MFVCVCVDMNCQQICKISRKKDITEVKIFQKFYGGGYFFETPCMSHNGGNPALNRYYPISKIYVVGDVHDVIMCANFHLQDVTETILSFEIVLYIYANKFDTSQT